MAAVDPLREAEDIYELELIRVREKIKTKFAELIDSLKVRENELLRELDNILASYLSYRRELEKANEKRYSLEKMKRLNEEEIATSPIKSFQENIVRLITDELKLIMSPIEPKLVSFECDSNKMLAVLNKLGKLAEKVRNGIDYKSKGQPLVSVCKKGKGMEQLDYPRGVTIGNETRNIYIADQSNNFVKVFDSTGNYLFKFGDNEGEGKMNCPLSVVICGDRILTSHNNNCIMEYQLDGKFFFKIGKEGKGELEFNWPVSVIIDDSNGNIFICDCYNNRIQILSQNFRFISQFGKDTLKKPRDVKLSKEYIIVLDESNPCLHLFNHNYTLQKSAISRGEGMDTISPIYFIIDQTNNVLISDFRSNSLHIFNTEFQLIHKIPVSNHPTGVTMDNQGRVIVVCQADKDCLQIF